MRSPPQDDQRLRRDWIVLGTVLFVLMLLVAAWILFRHHPLSPFVDSFPEPDEIAEIVIPIEPPLKADKSVSFIRVPESEFAALHALFQNSRIDNEPAKWVMFYPMHIILKNGSEMKVTVFLTNEDPGAFRINRTYYRGGTNKAFEEFLRRILPEGVELMME